MRRAWLVGWIGLAWGVAALASASGAESGEAGAPEGAATFELWYEARVVPTTRSARVRIRLVQEAPQLLGLRFRIDPERQREFEGDGEIVPGEGTLEWKPPPAGGSLRYQVLLDELRDARRYSARCAEEWALFRGDDLVPPARATLADGAHSRARLRLRLPEGWSAATPFPKADGGWLRIDRPHRRFDRPTGWIVAADRLGVVRERVAGTRVGVAGPAGQGLRRLDLLAMLRWNLPSLREAFGALPERLLVVGAGDPMWRGGLSGVGSLFVHADRPLITPDGTSPLLHEVVHTVLPLRAAEGSDWIIEGLAEFYSLEAMVRSGTLSRRRHERALERLVAEGEKAPRLDVEESSGAVTARAVAVLLQLDRELRRASGDARSLDDVVRGLTARGGEVDAGALRAVAEEVAQTELDGLFRRLEIPGA